ncbi:porin [Polaromonas glacialis]|uniref:porin n=1 Tax=Polaromonas glacialis TaxID=866564 RepID=UPI0004982B92|nr:porin [Polaromonas glacialis]
MKKTLIALTALSAIVGMAQAQSTVTLYGLIDTGIGSFKTNAVVGNTIQNLTQTSIQTDGLNGSRWGMRMSEDLGGGLAAVANLESGMAVDTGASAQGGLLFGRRANVGLSGGFGTVTMGRNSTSYDDVSADSSVMNRTVFFDPSQTNNGPATSVAGAPLTAVNAASLLSHGGKTWIGYQTRFNNSVKYTSPSFYGFSGSVTYALGEDKASPAAAANASKSVSAFLKYVSGPLLVSGGYQSEAPGGTLAVGGAGTTNAAVGGVKPALENALLSVAYDFGAVKIGAGFNRAKFKDVPAPAQLNGGVVGGSFDAQKEVSLSVAVPLGATTLSAGYAQSNGGTLGKSTGFGVQALYALSKRTTLYAGGLSTKAYDKLAAAVVVALPGSNIGHITTFAAGIRHTF